MANEIKKVENTKVTVNKKKGIFTGQAMQGVLGITPEGYGVLNFKDGDKLDGRFKNGMFLNGVVTTADGVKLEGDFDNFRLISGSVEYPNGDYLIGQPNEKTNEFEITEFRITQNFGDVVVGKVKKQDGKKVIDARMTYLDNSTFIGEFSMSKASANGLDFEKEFVDSSAYGVTRPVLTCEKAKANVLIKTPIGIAKLFGDYENGQINGVYRFEHDGYSQEVEGVFSFNRHMTQERATNYFSEDYTDYFASYAPTTPYIYDISIDEGKIQLKQGKNTFDIQKEQVEDASPIYSGEFIAKTNSGETNIAKGIFDASFNPINVEISFTGGRETVNGTLKKVGEKYAFDGQILFVSSEYYKGEFLAKATMTKFPTGMPKWVNVDFTFVSGQLKKVLEKKHSHCDKVYFEGKTSDLLIDDEKKGFEIYKAPSLADCRGKVKYVGKTFGKLQGEKEFSYTGLFDSQYNFMEGRVIDEIKDTREACVDVVKTYDGKNATVPKYIGVVQYKDGDTYEGTFDKNLLFIQGQVLEHCADKSVFKGETKDKIHYTGLLERSGDYWQNGEFIKKDDVFVFMKGNTLVHFDREDGAYVTGKYDEQGFATYGGKKLICTVHSQNKRDVVDIFVCDTPSEAIAEYDTKITNEKARKQLEGIDKSIQFKELFKKYSMQELETIIDEAMEQHKQLEQENLEK